MCSSRGGPKLWRMMRMLVSKLTIIARAIGEDQRSSTAPSAESALTVDWQGYKPSCARNGTGALIAQTMLTVLTQSMRTWERVPEMTGRRLHTNLRASRETIMLYNSWVQAEAGNPGTETLP